MQIRTQCVGDEVADGVVVVEVGVGRADDEVGAGGRDAVWTGVAEEEG
jgi:hypothetical protein